MMMNISRKFEENKVFWCFFAVVLNIALRFAFMYATDHFDFRQFMNTGRLVAAGENVYVATKYYNYGPLFSIILAIFYKVTFLFSNNVLVYKIFLVLLLTLSDCIAARLVTKTAGKFWGLIFFLNPVSLYVVGYQTQFDNVAVMLGAWGSYYIQKSSEHSKFTAYDLYGTVLLSLSLIMKHILWAFPLFILMNKIINTHKRFLYAFIPPLMFLFSFVPYLPEGLDGIISNVFMYRSANNFPLFGVGLMRKLGIYIGIAGNAYFAVYIVLMVITAYVFRNEDIYHSFLIYTMSAVCFASGMFGHQFVIPCMALVVIFRKWSVIFFAAYISRVAGADLRNTLCVWCLLGYIVYYYRYLRHKN